MRYFSLNKWEVYRMSSYRDAWFSATWVFEECAIRVTLFHQLCLINKLISLYIWILSYTLVIGRRCSYIHLLITSGLCFVKHKDVFT